MRKSRRDEGARATAVLAGRGWVTRGDQTTVVDAAGCPVRAGTPTPTHQEARRVGGGGLGRGSGAAARSGPSARGGGAVAASVDGVCRADRRGRGPAVSLCAPVVFGRRPCTCTCLSLPPGAWVGAPPGRRARPVRRHRLTSASATLPAEGPFPRARGTRAYPRGTVPAPATPTALPHAAVPVAAQRRRVHGVRRRGPAAADGRAVQGLRGRCRGEWGRRR